jgi:hypothetical protein
VRTYSESLAWTGAMYFCKKTFGGRAYLQIVESRREGAAVRQHADHDERWSRRSTSLFVLNSHWSV